MAQMTVQIVAGAQSGGLVQSFDNADALDFIAALRAFVFPWDDSRGPDARTNVQMINLWAAKVRDDAKTITKRYRQQQQIAALSTPDIIFT